MTKFEQEQINEMCKTTLDRVNTEIMEQGGLKDWSRLRTCQAEVSETSRYYVLRSYNTLVAFIDKTTDTLYDVLRYVYGYTATSAQHISKFEKDYCQGQWHCESRYTMR
ncbi:MAG: hypothetical protein J6S67_02015 [Methanobrevibacter sp.]|nr:hypothetical protein [Methanobrevibacter sp.]